MGVKFQLTLLSACSRSAIKYSGSSNPTYILTYRCSRLAASNSFGLIPEHLGITRLSCPPQLTAIMICLSASQNFTMDVILLVFTTNVNKPQAPVICWCASWYCGNDLSNGKMTASIFGCCFK